MFGFWKRQSEAEDETSSKAERADELWQQGSALLERRKVAAAIDVMREAMKVEPSRMDGRLNLGAALFLAGQHEEAVGHLKYVLAFDSQNSMALLNLAACYDALGRMDESIATLEQLVAERPGWKDAHYNLAVAYFKQKQYDKAADALRAELKLNPQNEAARSLLNKIHLMPNRKS
jgi:tetratricopeptide (TPR) repeat protein